MLQKIITVGNKTMFILLELSNKTKVVISGLLFIFLFFAAQSIAAQATVVEISGTWRVSSKQLKYGDYLKENDIIENKSRAKSDRIIVKSNGVTILSLFCNRAECDQKLVVRKYNSSGTISSRVWNYVADYFRSNPEYVVNITRGGLGDGIVFMYKDTADMTNFFKDQTAKRYRLKFVKRSNPEETIEQNVDTLMSKDAVEIKGLTPGIYELTDLKTPSDPDWILVVPIEKYCESITNFAEFKQETAAWKNEGVTPGVINGFNRAFLNYLEDSINSTNK